MKKLKTKSEMYSNFEIYAIVLNNENVPGPIISLIKKNQLKSLRGGQNIAMFL